MKLLLVISVFIFLTGVCIVLFGSALKITGINITGRSYRHRLWTVVMVSVLAALGITFLIFHPG